MTLGIVNLNQCVVEQLNSKCIRILKILYLIKNHGFRNGGGKRIIT